MIILYIVLLVLIGASIYLIIDYRGPATIDLKEQVAFGLKGLRAKELIIQEVDRDGSIWASRGLILYRKRKEDRQFVRMAHVPTGLSSFWLFNFTLFRTFTNKPECLEAIRTPEGRICALSAGYLWLRAEGEKRFRRSMKLPHYGLGVGRGILTYGITSTGDREIYWGEYFRNAGRSSVKIFKSSDGGLNWEVAREFEPGFTRHIHFIQQDPYTGRLWICMGDLDHESRIGWTGDGFRTITYIGSGSQVWRSSHVVFTGEAVFWGTDSGFDESAGIYRWDRASLEVERVQRTPGAILYGTGLKDGSLVFSTDREGFPIEEDPLTRLYVLGKDGAVSEIEAGTWKHREKGRRYSFAMLRFQRNQGAEVLGMSVINQQEFPAGTLLLFEEPALQGNNPQAGAGQAGT